MFVLHCVFVCLIYASCFLVCVGCLVLAVCLFVVVVCSCVRAVFCVFFVVRVCFFACV